VTVTLIGCSPCRQKADVLMPGWTDCDRNTAWMQPVPPERGCVVVYRWNDVVAYKQNVFLLLFLLSTCVMMQVWYNWAVAYVREK
jgi:hypothetical protein